MSKVTEYAGYVRGRVLVLEEASKALYKGNRGLLNRFFAPKHGPWGREAEQVWDETCVRFAELAAKGALDCNKDGGFIVLSAKAEAPAAFRWAQDVGRGWRLNGNYPGKPDWIGDQDSEYLESFRGRSDAVGWFGFPGDCGCEHGVLVLKFRYASLRAVMTELIRQGRFLLGMDGQGLGSIMGGREPGSYKTIVGSRGGGREVTVLALGPVWEGGVIREDRLRVALKGFPFAEFEVNKSDLFE